MFFTVNRSTGHGLPHGIWQQYELQTFTWLPASARHGLQHRLRWQHRSQTPIGTLAAVQRIDVILASGGSTSHGHRKAFGSNTGHGCSWTKDPDMAPGASRPQILPGPLAGVPDWDAHINTTSRRQLRSQTSAWFGVFPPHLYFSISPSSPPLHCRLTRR